MYQTILLPIDPEHGERVETMLAAARAISGPDRRIVCVHVVPEPPASVSLVMPPEVFSKMVSNARAAVEALIADAGPDVSVEIMSGHPSRTILKAAKAIDADLIIIGSHRPGLEDYLLGSTAASVVRHANCAVLVQR